MAAASAARCVSVRASGRRRLRRRPPSRMPARGVRPGSGAAPRDEDRAQQLAVRRQRCREDVRQPEGAPDAAWRSAPPGSAARRIVEVHGRQDRLRPRRPRPRRDQRRVEDRRTGPTAHHDQVVGLGARAQLAHDRLHDRVGRDGPREALEDPGEVLDLLARPRLALLHAAAGEGGGARDGDDRQGDGEAERERRQDDPGDDEGGEGGDRPGEERPGERGRARRAGPGGRAGRAAERSGWRLAVGHVRHRMRAGAARVHLWSWRRPMSRPAPAPV